MRLMFLLALLGVTIASAVNVEKRRSEQLKKTENKLSYAYGENERIQKQMKNDHKKLQKLLHGMTKTGTMK